ncbi:MAG: pyridoxamine 5'-phosphate oxidase family protein [Nitrospinota bacterium]|nr:pyridoxamine 5'-phosphate oxidase family protein [Nitrospinota bacterium]
MSDVKKNVKECLSAVKTISVATSVDDKPSCRIMELQRVDDDLKIWLVTHNNSLKIKQLNKNSSACIVSFNHETAKDIRLYGKMDIRTDREAKEYVWKDDLNKYFEDGINDPLFAVLTFSPEKLEFRDIKKGSLFPEVENL